jgi:hypothetical protein
VRAGLGTQTLHRTRPGTTPAPDLTCPLNGEDPLAHMAARGNDLRQSAFHPGVPRLRVRSGGWCSDGVANTSLTASGAADALCPSTWIAAEHARNRRF